MAAGRRWSKGKLKITARPAGEEPIEVDAMILQPEKVWAIHRGMGWRKGTWAVSHVPSGGLIWLSGFPTMKACKAALAEMIELNPEFATMRNSNDVYPYLADTKRIRAKYHL